MFDIATRNVAFLKLARAVVTQYFTELLRNVLQVNEITFNGEVAKFGPFVQGIEVAESDI